jgi:hypothetical protein
MSSKENNYRPGHRVDVSKALIVAAVCALGAIIGLVSSAISRYPGVNDVSPLENPTVALRAGPTTLGSSSNVTAGKTPQTSAPAPADLLCGPRSVYYCALRLGVMSTFDDVSARLDVAANGASMLQLKKLAEELGLSPSGEMLTWEKLKNIDGVALLFVNGNHFVCADPREGSPDSEEDAVRVYDDGPAEWWDRRRLEAAWNGESLVIYSAPGDVSSGPRAMFSALLEDVGEHTVENEVSADFHVRNTGDSTLVIDERVETSCGCAKPIINQYALAPGEETTIRFAVDLEGKRGQFSQYAVITTNDPLTPRHRMYVQGRAVDNRLTLAKDLTFRPIRSGTQGATTLTVFDPGDGTLELRECQAFITATAEAVGEGMVSVSATWDEETVPGRDVPVMVRAEVKEGCFPGEFSGELRILANLPGESRRLVVPFQGEILPPWQANPPSLIMLLTDKLSDEYTRTINIESAVPVEITEVNVTDLPVKVSFQNDPRPTLRVQCSLSDVSARSVRGAIACTFSNGGRLLIPCQLVRPGM